MYKDVSLRKIDSLKMINLATNSMTPSESFNDLPKQVQSNFLGSTPCTVREYSRDLV